MIASILAQTRRHASHIFRRVHVGERRLVIEQHPRCIGRKFAHRRMQAAGEAIPQGRCKRRRPGGAKRMQPARGLRERRWRLAPPPRRRSACAPRSCGSNGASHGAVTSQSAPMSPRPIQRREHPGERPGHGQRRIAQFNRAQQRGRARMPDHGRFAHARAQARARRARSSARRANPPSPCRRQSDCLRRRPGSPPHVSSSPGYITATERAMTNRPLRRPIPARHHLSARLGDGPLRFALHLLHA